MTAEATRSGEGSRKASSAQLAAHSSLWGQRIYWFAFAGTVLLAGLLRCVQLNESLWLDELHTAWIVADGWDEIPWRARIGNQSPLYFYLVAAVTGIGGLHEVTLRLLSAIAGVALVPCAGWLLTRWTGSRAAGLLAALLLAVDRNSVFYSQEARPYALVQLVGLLNTAVFVEVLRRPGLRLRAMWVGTASLLFYLHYTAILLLAAQAAAYSVFRLTRSWKPQYRIRQVAVDMAVLLACLSPSISHLREIAERRGAWSMFIGKNLDVSEIVSLFPLEVYLLLPVGVCFASWIMVWLSEWVGRQRLHAREDWRITWDRWSFGSAGSVDPRLLIVLGSWLFVPLTVAWVLTTRDVARLFFLRYLIVSAVVPALVSGILLLPFPGRFSRCFGSLMIVATLIWQGGMIEQIHRDGRVIGDRRQDWRGAISLLWERVSGSDTPVFIRSGLIEADQLREVPSPRLREYCLLPVSGIYRLSVRREDLIPLPTSRSGELGSVEVERIACAGEAWFLLIGSPSSIDRIESDVKKAIEGGREACAVRTERHSFGDVAVLRVLLDP